MAFGTSAAAQNAVKGTAASYSATVTRVAEPEKLTLNPAEFVKPEGGPPVAEEFEAG